MHNSRVARRRSSRSVKSSSSSRAAPWLRSPVSTLTALRSSRSVKPSYAAACAAGGGIDAIFRQQAGRFDFIYLHRVENAAAFLNLARQHSKAQR
jgi:hypothetical protein